MSKTKNVVIDDQNKKNDKPSPHKTDGDYDCEAAKESDIDNFINID